MTLWLRYLAVALACLGGPYVSAQPAPIALQAAAETALIEKRTHDAIALTDSILAETPDNFAALFVQAAAMMDLGQHKQASRLALQAYKNATTRTERLQAARLASRAHFRAKQFARAEWWLRRATNQVATEEEAARLFQQFQTVRRENPLSVQANLGIAPSDNFNRGADEAFILFDGLGTIELPPEQRPLSGVEYSGDVRFEFRLDQNERQETRAGLYFYGRTYTPSQSAKEAVPGIRGEDYAVVLAETYLSQSRVIVPDWGLSRATFHVGRLDYGGDPFWDYHKLSLFQDFGLNEKNVLTILASREWQTGIEGRHSDTRVTILGARWTGTRKNQDSYQLSLTTQNYDTDAFESSYKEHEIQFGYRFAKPYMGITWGGSVGLGHTDYDTFYASLNGRRDTYIFGTASAIWTDVSYFGFSPRLDMTAERRISDVGQFSTSSLQVRLGIESNF